jgi:hypothetical protein
MARSATWPPRAIFDPALSDGAIRQSNLEGAALSAPLADATPTEPQLRAATTERGPPTCRSTRRAHRYGAFRKTSTVSTSSVPSSPKTTPRALVSCRNPEPSGCIAKSCLPFCWIRVRLAASFRVDWNV